MTHCPKFVQSFRNLFRVPDAAPIVWLKKGGYCSTRSFGEGFSWILFINLGPIRTPSADFSERQSQTDSLKQQQTPFVIVISTEILHVFLCNTLFIKSIRINSSETIVHPVTINLRENNRFCNIKRRHAWAKRISSCACSAP